MGREVGRNWEEEREEKPYIMQENLFSIQRKIKNKSWLSDENFNE